MVCKSRLTEAVRGADSILPHKDLETAGKHPQKVF